MSKKNLEKLKEITAIFDNETKKLGYMTLVISIDKKGNQYSTLRFRGRRCQKDFIAAMHCMFYLCKELQHEGRLVKKWLLENIKLMP